MAASAVWLLVKGSRRGQVVDGRGVEVPALVGHPLPRPVLHHHRGRDDVGGGVRVGPVGHRVLLPGLHPGRVEGVGLGHPTRQGLRGDLPVRGVRRGHRPGHRIGDRGQVPPRFDGPVVAELLGRPGRVHHGDGFAMDVEDGVGPGPARVDVPGHPVQVVVLLGHRRDHRPGPVQGAGLHRVAGVIVIHGDRRPHRRPMGAGDGDTGHPVRPVVGGRRGPGRGPVGLGHHGRVPGPVVPGDGLDRQRSTHPARGVSGDRPTGPGSDTAAPPGPERAGQAGQVPARPQQHRVPPATIGLSIHDPGTVQALNIVEYCHRSRGCSPSGRSFPTSNLRQATRVPTTPPPARIQSRRARLTRAGAPL